MLRLFFSFNIPFTPFASYQIIVSLLFFVNTLYFVILVKDTNKWFDDIQFYAAGISALAAVRE